MALPSDFPQASPSMAEWIPGGTQSYPVYLVAYQGPESWEEIPIPSKDAIGHSADNPLTLEDYITGLVQGLRNLGYQIWASKTVFDLPNETVTEVAP